jgi:tetratricopeptide (TPR) repeat protein
MTHCADLKKELFKMKIHHPLTVLRKPFGGLLAGLLLAFTLQVQAADASPGAAALKQGMALFDKGLLGKAEKMVKKANKLGFTRLEEVQQAHKTLAFIQCGTHRPAQCEKSFEEALKLDPSFQLNAVERKNPLWTPTFNKVKQRMSK